MNDKTTDQLKQLNTFNILLSIPPMDLRHLCDEVGLDLDHYTTHHKRASGFLIYLYQDVGLVPAIRTLVDGFFTDSK